MGGNGEELMATYLVTGANRGIGLAYCQQLQARGDAVIAVYRQLSPELAVSYTHLTLPTTGIV